MSSNSDFNIIPSDDDVKIPDECEKSEEAIKSMYQLNLEEHYTFLSLFVLVIIFLAAAVFCMVVSSSTAEDDTDRSTFSDFLSGKYEQKLEAKYIQNLPYTDVVKACEERVSLIYGFGNKLTAKKHTEDIITPNNDNNSTDDTNSTSDKDVVTKKADETQTKVVTTTINNVPKYTQKGTGTLAVTRPATKATTSTVSTKATKKATTKLTTTNNNPPATTATTNKGQATTTKKATVTTKTTSATKATTTQATEIVIDDSSEASSNE